MDPVFLRFKKAARSIVGRYPVPDFYRELALEWSDAKRMLATDGLLMHLTDWVADRIENDFGHGLKHALLVARDAGALVLAETKGMGTAVGEQAGWIRMVQAASLLHDINRKCTDHSEAGAETARGILKALSMPPDVVESVCYAIRSHEAFKDRISPPTPEADLIAGCLYDADKFRWGPDNFTDTIWDMVAFSEPTPLEFLRRFPSGMEKLYQIRDTFRTPTGRRFGPQFIDVGIAVGEELLKTILRDYPNLR